MKKKKEKKYSPISKRQSEEMTQFKESKRHTQVMHLGDHISCRIRKMKTIQADKEADINVDMRKFLNDKYPFKGGIQGITIPFEKWSEFVQKVIDFSMSACPEIFYPDEPQPVQQQENIIHTSLQQNPVVKTPEPKRRKPIPIEEQSWIEVISKGKK